ncbi:MAG: hypothetical protein AAGF66_07035 [Cyanobacteria bacterium P01_H01_bin.119]
MFHHKQHIKDMGAPKIRAYLSHLAISGMWRHRRKRLL